MEFFLEKFGETFRKIGKYAFAWDTGASFEPPEASEFINDLLEKIYGNLQFFWKLHEFWANFFYENANFNKNSVILKIGKHDGLMKIFYNSKIN